MRARTTTAASFCCAISVALLAGIGIGYEYRKALVDRKESNRFAAEQNRRIANLGVTLSDIKSLSVRMEPRLGGETDHLRVALLLRNMIYTRVAFRPEKGFSFEVDGYDWFDIAGTFAQSMMDPRKGHWCSGKTILYLAALRAFGVTARRISMFQSVTDFTDETHTHASAEVLTAGKWIALDPTFNISLRDEEGNRIGWVEAAGLISSGKTIKTDLDGFAERDGLTVSEYLRRSEITLADYLNYWVVGPYYSNGVRAGSRSPGWNGMLHYASGRTYDVYASDHGPVYYFQTNAIRHQR